MGRGILGYALFYEMIGNILFIFAVKHLKEAGY